MSSTTAGDISIPNHVPAELVRYWDVYSMLNVNVDAEGNPFSEIDRVSQEFPEVFYSPAQNYDRQGIWYFTREQDLRRIVQDPDTFSSRDITGFSKLAGGSFPLIPSEIDPPQHAKYRQFLMPFFSPKKVQEMEIGIRAAAIKRINGFAAEGNCEFMSAFGQPFPIFVTLQLMDLPAQMFDSLCTWESQMLHSADLSVCAQGAMGIYHYLQSVIAERKIAKSEDLISTIVHAQIDGRALSDDEMMGMTFLVLSGGLDTVASSLGFFFLHLARNPELQTQLRAAPEKIPALVEELLRAYSIVNVPRRVTRDVEVAGVQLKAGDWAAVLGSLGSRDSNVHRTPDQVRTDRGPIRHMAFSAGPHVCIGQHLARLEIRIALEEWLSRIPPFQVRSGSRPRIHGGGVFGVDELQLSWV